MRGIGDGGEGARKTLKERNKFSFLFICLCVVSHATLQQRRLLFSFLLAADDEEQVNTKYRLC